MICFGIKRKKNNYFFLKKILKNINKIIKPKIISISDVKISRIVKDFNSIIFEKWLPKYENNNIVGANPINDVIKILIFEILSNEIQIFWNNKGGPIISLINIKYSYEELLIYVDNLSENLT